jgi:hypothetical protein
MHFCRSFCVKVIDVVILQDTFKREDDPSTRGFTKAMSHFLLSNMTYLHRA